MSEQYSVQWTVGDRVRLIFLPTYVKTADPMPMLRPPTVLQLGEEGVVIGQRSGNYWSIRFQRGAFLLEGRYLERITDDNSGFLSLSPSNAQ